MAEGTHAHLGAGGASCQICFEPFGQLEDLSAPFIVTCGHVFCVGCLNDAGAYCPLCGMAYDRPSYLRLLSLRTTVPRQPRRSYDSEVMGAKLRNDFARVSSLTSVAQLRSLHGETRYFLSSQPRNRFNDLETNNRLLQYLLETKETLQTHSTMMNTFIQQIHQLNSEKTNLSSQLLELERRYTSERAYIRNHVADFLRRDPDYRLLSDEVLRFHTDINDLRESVHTLRVQNNTQTTAPVAPEQTPEFAPRIRVYPASRSPSPVPSALESAYEALSPLSMSAIGEDFGTGRPQVYSDNLDIPTRAGSRLSNADPAREREAVFAQIRRRTRLSYSSAPDLRSLSEIPALVSRESSERDGESSSLYESSEHDGGDTPYYSPVASMSDSLISQTPSASDTDTVELAESSTVIEHSEAQVPETPSLQSSHEPSDHDNNTSAPISTISTPSLPLLRTPPSLRLQEDLNNQLLLTTTTSRLIVEPDVSLPLPARLRRHLPPSLNVRALNDLLHDLIGRPPEHPNRRHQPEFESGSHPGMGGGDDLQVQGGGGLITDVRAGLVEVIARVLVRLAENTSIHAGPISPAAASASAVSTQVSFGTALRAVNRSAEEESLDSASDVVEDLEMDPTGRVVEPGPVRATDSLPPLDDDLIIYELREPPRPELSDRDQKPLDSRDI